MTDIAQNTKEEISSSPPKPIVLTTPANPETQPVQKTNRGFLSTLAILFAGWLVGNLILLSILGLGAASLAGATGLVKVPFLTEYFFGKAATTNTLVDDYALHNGEEKLQKIQELSEEETLETLVFYEDEINALLAHRASSDQNFPINWQNFSLLDNGFVFSGVLRETNAPVIIKGTFSTSGLSGTIEITQAKYGKISIPSFIATNIVESHLSALGLSLNNNKIPAKAVEISQGVLKLSEVTTFK